MCLLCVRQHADCCVGQQAGHLRGSSEVQEGFPEVKDVWRMSGYYLRGKD